MDQWWKIWLTEWKRKSSTSTKVEESKREAFRGRGAPWWRRVRKNKKYRIKKWGEDCWARSFSLFDELNLQRLQCNQEESTEEEEMKQQQRMMIIKNLTKKIRSEGRMDAKKIWWVSELLAADCGKAWVHTGCEYIMQKWYKWLEETKKRDEKEKMEEMHQHKVAQMIKSAEGSAGLFAQNHEAHSMEGRSTDPGERTEHGGQTLENEELRKWEEALPRSKECDLEKVSRMYKSKNRSRM